MRFCKTIKTLGFSLMLIFFVFPAIAADTNPTSNSVTSAQTPAPTSTTPNTIATPATKTPEKPKPIPQYTISIVSPQPEETFQSDTMELTVTVAVKPELEKEDTVAILVDGTQVAVAHDTNVTVPYMERGSHTIQAKVIQPKGKGAESEIITIFQQRHSILLPAH